VLDVFRDPTLFPDEQEDESTPPEVARGKSWRSLTGTRPETQDFGLGDLKKPQTDNPVPGSVEVGQQLASHSASVKRPGLGVILPSGTNPTSVAAEPFLSSHSNKERENSQLVTKKTQDRTVAKPVGKVSNLTALFEKKQAQDSSAPPGRRPTLTPKLASNNLHAKFESQDANQPPELGPPKSARTLPPVPPTSPKLLQLKAEAPTALPAPTRSPPPVPDPSPPPIPRKSSKRLRKQSEKGKEKV
jgi:hypothetical protein